MENLTQSLIQSEPFSQNQGTFFDFKKGQGRPPPSPSSCALVRNLIDAIFKDTPVKYVARLGKKARGNTRTIKVILNSSEDKKKIFENLSKLKGIVKFEKVIVSEDFTIGDQEILKTWHDKV